MTTPEGTFPEDQNLKPEILEALRKYSGIIIGDMLIDRNPEALADRMDSFLCARSEVNAEVLKELPDGATLSEKDEKLTDFALIHAYRTFASPYLEDDITRSVRIETEYMSMKKTAGETVWLPDVNDPSVMKDVVERVRLVSTLSDADNSAAYQPHANGRPPEIMDNSGAWYNKYGRLLVRPEFPEQ